MITVYERHVTKIYFGSDVLISSRNVTIKIYHNLLHSSNNNAIDTSEFGIELKAGMIRYSMF